MSQENDPLKQLSRYARVARNSQMLLVMEPPEDPAPEVKEAREAIVEDAQSFLNEVAQGIESPYFTTYARPDRKFRDLIAVEKIHQAIWDRVGIFELSPLRQVSHDSQEASDAQTATFAYIAARWMSAVKVPFYLAPNLRAGVTPPHNLAEFYETVRKVKEVTTATQDVEFHDVVKTNDWRVAFAFWEANRQLASAMVGPS